MRLAYHHHPIRMIRQVLGGSRQSLPISSLLRQMHIGENARSINITTELGQSWIGIPPDMLQRSTYRTPDTPSTIITPVESPPPSSNLQKEIEDSPTSGPARIEKQAARLIVIRRSKMNKHKLRKLRKKMKYVWAKVKLRRAIRKEKAYLNSKMELINAARAFNPKEYVAGIIKRAKEELLPRKWTDPLCPEWFKEQEMKREAAEARYQKMINLYVNKSINIDFTDKKK